MNCLLVPTLLRSPLHKYGEARHFGMDAEIQRPWKATKHGGVWEIGATGFATPSLTFL